MNISLVYMILFISLLFCNNKKQAPNVVGKKTTTEMSDPSFTFHFKILDSAVKANPQDTIYTCCTPSIKFMEVNTNIEAHSDGTYLGKLIFSKEDLRKWHEWYNNNIKK